MLVDVPTLRRGLYQLPDDPIGPEVLIPSFRASTSVRGAFGYFTAEWIEKLAPGLADYLNQEETAPIRFTLAPALFRNERAEVEKAQDWSAEQAAEQIASIFTEGRVNASALARHALDCLAWMIATDRLRLRIAVPKSNSTFHPKMWLFDDGEHQVLVRGSANATGSALNGNIEQMDVDVSWTEAGGRIVAKGAKMIDDWDRGDSAGLTRTVDLPTALREKIITTAPPARPTADDYAQAAQDDASPAWATDELDRLRARFPTTRASRQRPRLRIPENLEWKTGAYAHQGEAVHAWESKPTPDRGTIAMATGAGKTITALICASRLQDRLSDASLLLIVSAPSIPLIHQWQGEVRRFGVEPSTPTLDRDTPSAITNLLRSLNAGGASVAIVTNHLLCADWFQETISRGLESATRPVSTMLIADEAHTLGTERFLNSRLDFIERRLALSATPERQYDPDGTEGIFEFFGPTVFEFGLGRAIGFCLAPYDYYVHATTLAHNELDEFLDLTRRIRQRVAISGADEDDTAIKHLLIQRRRIIETAQAKLDLLGAVLSHRGPRDIAHALVYASSKDPDQFTSVGALLGDLGVRWAPVTEDTTSRATALSRTLTTFTDGGYQVLVAKRVLDEGVDIPSIREAFIVASSTVHREWIQRRGRILRLHPDKPWAVLHDFLALPPASVVRSAGSADQDLKTLIQGELSRALAFASHARNGVGDTGALTHLRRIRDTYWDGSAPGLPLLDNPGDSIIAPDTPIGFTC